MTAFARRRQETKSELNTAEKHALAGVKISVSRTWEKIKRSVEWIPANCTTSSLKPVIRSSVSSWLALVLLIMPRVQFVIGDASFLMLMIAFVSPPKEPLAGVIEKEIITVFLVTLSWAWSSLGIFLANLARTTFNRRATLAQVLSGQYIEAAPSVIYAVFIFLGSAFLLVLRSLQGPGPFEAATFFALICVDICLTVAPLYPYPFYRIGTTVVIPTAIHAGLTILASLLICPESVSKQFVDRLKTVLGPLATGIKQQHRVLQTSPHSDYFNANSFSADISKSESAFAALGASAKLLKKDVSWGRFNGNDLRSLEMFGRTLTMRAAGMDYFYQTMDSRRRKFPETPLPSQPATPMETPTQSGPITPNVSEGEDDAPPDRTTTRGEDRGSANASLSSLHRKRRLPLLLSHIPHHHHHLLREALNHSQEHRPVGVFESQQYMNIERRRHHPQGEVFEETSLRLLAESVGEFLAETGAAMDHVVDWLDRVNAEGFWFWRGRDMPWKESVAANEQALDRLDRAIKKFSAEKHAILEPYKGVLDPLQSSRDLPPHRYLFRSFLYQYHLVRFSEGLQEMIQEIDHLDKNRRRSRLWPPLLPLRRILIWNGWEADELTEILDDENPDVIPGISVKSQDLGAAEPRNADALPPTNIVELAGSRVYTFMSSIGGGTAQFALKAGILSVLLSLPSFVKESAAFAYQRKSLWALFLAQVTLARYRGDTIFGFLSRLLSSFLGGVVGLTFWYISSGNGPGNPYGVAATGAVFFPILMFVRIHTPGPPVTTVLFTLTIALIIGYSWQDTHFPSSANQGHGADVAWRRFLPVAIGVTAASILSFLPPSKTIRRYHRTALSTTTSEIGFLYCAIISYAHSHREDDGKEIIENTIALHSKLKRMRTQTTNIQYEFSLRGKWPTDRYNTVLDLQLEIVYLLSHLMSVVDNLDPAWSRAFLQRTRFLDPDFLGDVLAVISMISMSLRTATPLPQITPAPLLNRFLKFNHGLNVLQQEAADNYGLPRAVTFETLQNDQYRCFSVGISSASGIISRLDLLMHATKELVGERFHVEGIFLSSPRSNSISSGGAHEKPSQVISAHNVMKTGKAVSSSRLPESSQNSE